MALIELWTNFLPIANVAFALAFALVVYSTATGVGLSNYSVKKILPRLIVVAIAVNTSFYLCAILADLTNILAAGVPSLFFGIGSGTDPFSMNSYYQAAYGSSVDYIGGGIASVLVAIVLIFCFLGTILVTILTIFVAIAARQALLTMLVVISPLAIVCAVLPKTEKWFQKWAKTYVQLLIIYPLFMLAFMGVRYIQLNGLLTGGNVEADAALQSNPVGFFASLLLPIAPLLLIKPMLSLSGTAMGKITGAIDKSPLGTQGTLGKAASARDETRRKLMSSRVQSASSNLKDREIKNTKLDSAERQALSDYQTAKANSQQGIGHYNQMFNNNGEMITGITKDDQINAGWTPAEQQNYLEMSSRDNKMLEQRSEIGGRGIRRGLSAFGARALSLPYGGRNRRSAVDQMSQMAQNENYANWMNNERRARRYGGAINPLGSKDKTGRYSTALQGQAVATKLELDKKSTQGAAAIISDSIASSMKRGLSQWDAMGQAMDKYRNDKFQIKGLTEALIGQGSLGISRFKEMLDGPNALSGNMRFELNESMKANKSAIEAKDVIAMSAAKYNISYSEAAGRADTYNESPVLMAAQNPDVIKKLYDYDVIHGTTLWQDHRNAIDRNPAARAAAKKDVLIAKPWSRALGGDDIGGWNLNP